MCHSNRAVTRGDKLMNAIYAPFGPHLQLTTLKQCLVWWGSEGLLWVFSSPLSSSRVCGGNEESIHLCLCFQACSSSSYSMENKLTLIAQLCGILPLGSRRLCQILV